MLAMFKDDLKSDDMSFAQPSDILNTDNENTLLAFLTDHGILAKGYVFEFCRGNMQKAE